MDRLLLKDTFRWLSSQVRFSTYLNAVHLWANAAVTAISGFVFWTIATRLYTPDDVGKAAAIISAVLLIANVSQLGLGFGVIRYLPSDDAEFNHLVNWSSTVVALMAALFAVLFVLGTPVWAPGLQHQLLKPLPMLAFVTYSLVISETVLQGFLFLAVGSSKHVPSATLILVGARIPLAMLLALAFPMFSLVHATGMAGLLALTYGTIVLMSARAGYRPRVSIKPLPSLYFLNYSLSNFVSGILAILPTLVLPLFAVNVLGSETSAYFFIAWTLGTMTHSISDGLGRAFFAERSLAERKTPPVHKIMLVSVGVAVLLSVLLVIGGRWILLIFGEDYSRSSHTLLSLLALSSIGSAISNVYLSILRIRAANRELVFLTALQAGLLLSLSYYMLNSSLGINGAGLASVAAHGIVAIYSLLAIRKFWRWSDNLGISI